MGACVSNSILAGDPAEPGSLSAPASPDQHSQAEAEVNDDGLASSDGEYIPLSDVAIEDAFLAERRAECGKGRPTACDSKPEAMEPSSEEKDRREKLVSELMAIMTDLVAGEFLLKMSHKELESFGKRIIDNIEKGMT